MKRTFLFRHFLRFIRNFARSEAGMTLPLLAVSMVAITGMVGLAIDTARLQIVQSKLQFSLDAAGLAGGATVSTSDLNTEVTKYLNVNFNGYMGATVTATNVTANSANTVFNLTATATMPSTFMNVLGIKTLTVNASSQISRALSGLELVLALDNSSSIQPAISYLQTAAIDLINDLAPSTSSSNVFVGVVPFQGFVNIGTSYTGWLGNTSTTIGTTTTTTSSLYASNGCVDGRQTQGGTDYEISTGDAIPPTTAYSLFNLRSYKQCVCPTGTTISPYNNGSSSAGQTTDGATPTTATCSGYTPSCTSGGTLTCSKSGGTASCNASGSTVSCSKGSAACSKGTLTCTTSTPTCTDVSSCTPTTGTSPTTTCTANGNYAYTQPLPSGQTYGVSYVSGSSGCPPQIQPLTNNASTLTSSSGAIEKLNGAGGSGSDLAQGIIWAWYMLSPNWRSTWALANPSGMGAYGLPLNYGGAHEKVAVLISDGATSYSGTSQEAYWYSADNWTDASGSSLVTEANADTRTLAACTAMKNLGITIYTIGLDTGSITTANQETLCQCSSNTSCSGVPGSSPPYYYYAPAYSNLAAIFNSIGDSLASLRVSQ